MQVQTKPVSSQVQVEEKQSAQDLIASAQREVRVEQARVDKMVNELQRMREKLPQFGRLEELLEKVEAAREALAMAESSNQALNDKKDEISLARVDLRAARYELSDLLVHWMAKFKQKSLMFEAKNHAIKVRAEIGKELSNDQEVLPL